MRPCVPGRCTTRRQKSLTTFVLAMAHAQAKPRACATMDTMALTAHTAAPLAQLAASAPVSEHACFVTLACRFVTFMGFPLILFLLAVPPWLCREDNDGALPYLISTHFIYVFLFFYCYAYFRYPCRSWHLLSERAL